MKRVTRWTTMLIALLLMIGGCGTDAKGGINVELNLTWTAPGDDGATGTAAQYDIRWADSPGQLTVDTWDQATAVVDPPAPSPAGSTEHFTFTLTEQDLTSEGTYYIALRAADEASNWSEPSNIATFVVPDFIGPVPPSGLTVIINITITNGQ